MKWKESDFNSGIQNINAVLIYGPDAGLVDELCDKAIEKLEIEKDNLLALDANELREKQDAVFAESCSPSMFGGRKAVLISGAGDSDTKIISDLVTSSSLCATVIVSAGDLRVGSLRKLFEDGDSITPSSVIPKVCSHCADKLLSFVRTVQPSFSSVSQAKVPTFIIGSIVKTKPGCIINLSYALS